MTRHDRKATQNKQGVVKELSYRFVEKECGFQIRSDVVSFLLIDVCVGIGLRIGGEKVDLKRDSSDSTSGVCLLQTMLLFLWLMMNYLKV